MPAYRLDEHLLAEWSDSKQALGQHLAFFAAERYHSANGRWPGSDVSMDAAAEQQQMEALVQAVIGGSGGALPDEVTEGIAEVYILPHFPWDVIS